MSAVVISLCLAAACVGGATAAMVGAYCGALLAVTLHEQYRTAGYVPDADDMAGQPSAEQADVAPAVTR